MYISYCGTLCINNQFLSFAASHSSTAHLRAFFLLQLSSIVLRFPVIDVCKLKYTSETSTESYYPAFSDINMRIFIQTIALQKFKYHISYLSYGKVPIKLGRRRAKKPKLLIISYYKCFFTLNVMS